MVNPIRGEAELQLKDGRQLKLVFDMEALISAEAAYGQPLQQMMLDAQRGFFGAIRSLLFGSMQTHHPNISKEEALSIFMDNTDEVQAALESAGKNGFVKAEETTEDGEEKNPRRGKTSGRSGAKRG